MENPEASVTDLMSVIPGPDFPTGALVMGESGIRRGPRQLGRPSPAAPD